MATNPTPKTKTLAEQLFNLPVSNLSYLQETAMSLYSLGLNVFPVPYGRKGGYPWRMLQYVRLNPEDIYPLFRGQCNLAIMAGRTSDNLFIIDCETAEVFKHQEHLLQEAGVPIWATKTNGSKGGGHFYLRSKAGEIKSVRPGERKDYEVKGRTYVLAPTSLHPETRQLYQWHIRETPEPPEVTLDQVSWLSLTLSKTRPKETTPQPFVELSSTTRDFLLIGAKQGTRNNRLFAAACDLAGNDYDHHSAVQLLVPVAQKCGLPNHEIFNTIHSAYNQPRTPAKPTSQKEQKPKPFELAISWARAQTWRDRTGQTDKAVFLACCERARTANKKGVFRASSRELAELARITRKTASKSLKRLIEAKLLVFAGRNNTSGANLYRLATKPIKEGGKNYRYYPTIPLPSIGNGVITIKTDAVEREALGKTAYGLFQAMQGLSASMKPRELVVLSKLSIQQIYRALRKLRAYDLVTKSKQGYKVIPMTDEALNHQVALRAKTLGKGAARKAQHRRERALIAAQRIFKARKSEDQSSLKFMCGNCGQIWGSLPDLSPPLVCDYCKDCTTWKSV